MAYRIEGREPAYPAARLVAARIEDHFLRHAAAGDDGAAGAPLPDAVTIEALIDAAFWASLRREEGFSPTISLAFVPPEQAGGPLTFAEALPLAPERMTRLAPAVERPGIHLGVWTGSDGLVIWGATRRLPPLCFVLEVVAPGVLVVKHRRREDSGKFINVAVLEGDQIKVIDEQASTLPDCPTLVTALVGFDTLSSWTTSVNVLVELAISMRAHRRGGTLLVVPQGDAGWLESVVLPMAYAVSPAYTGLADVAATPPDDDQDSVWRDTLRRRIDAVAGLTAVDGATVISDRYELLGFGAKIARRRGATPVERVGLTEPIVGVAPAVVHPSQLGGTRHLSAAQFVHDQQGALALVASQDGRFTVFAWSPCEGLVHAHRVETLLL